MVYVIFLKFDGVDLNRSAEIFYVIQELLFLRLPLLALVNVVLVEQRYLVSRHSIFPSQHLQIFLRHRRNLLVLFQLLFKYILNLISQIIFFINLNIFYI